jgi:hypothetical protein
MALTRTIRGLYVPNLLGVDLHLRNDHDLRAAGDGRHQREVAAVTAHHLDRKHAVVRGGGDLEAVDRLEGNVQRRIGADRDVAAE